MAHVALPARAAGDPFDITIYNYIRGNFEVYGPAIVTTKGDLVVATAANTLARLAVGTDGARLRANSAVAAGVDWQIVPACRVYNDADIDPATGAWVALTFNTEWFDHGGMHSTVTNPSRLTVPAGGAGVYHVGGAAIFDCSATAAGESYYGLQIIVNGADVYAEHRFSLPNRSMDHGLNISCDVTLAVADYIELRVYTSSDYNVLAAGAYAPAFWAHLVR
jgi:hypothetical protein